MTCKYGISNDINCNKIIVRLDNLGSLRKIYPCHGKLWPSCLSPDKLVVRQISNSTLDWPARRDWRAIRQHCCYNQSHNTEQVSSHEKKRTNWIAFNCWEVLVQYDFIVTWHDRVNLICRNIYTNIKTQEVFVQLLSRSLSRTIPLFVDQRNFSSGSSNVCMIECSCFFFLLVDVLILIIMRSGWNIIGFQSHHLAIELVVADHS